jgi:hypothetical protein
MFLWRKRHLKASNPETFPGARYYHTQCQLKETPDTQAVNHHRLKLIRLRKAYFLKHELVRPDMNPDEGEIGHSTTLKPMKLI